MSSVLCKGRQRRRRSNRFQARIADFGLAGLAKNIRSAEVRAGTPAYIGTGAIPRHGGHEAQRLVFPRTLALRAVFWTPRVRCQDPRSLAILRQESKVPSLRTLVPDVDPVVDRVVTWCLEKDGSAAGSRFYRTKVHLTRAAWPESVTRRTTYVPGPIEAGSHRIA